MRLKLWHGRIHNPDMRPTDIDGKVIDEWGFDGPVLEHVSGMRSTYGDIEVLFESESAYEAAKLLTGWEDGIACGYSLAPKFFEDLVQIHHPVRLRDEFFGDWDLTLVQ